MGFAGSEDQLRKFINYYNKATTATIEWPEKKIIDKRITHIDDKLGNII